VAEGAPLLREYGVKNSIEGSNPSLSAIFVKGGSCESPLTKIMGGFKPSMDQSAGFDDRAYARENAASGGPKGEERSDE
jgi:hypothetical protein